MFYIAYTDKMGCRMSSTHKRESVAIKEFKFLAKRSREVALYREPFHSTTQLEKLVMWNSPCQKCYWGNSLQSSFSSEQEKKDIRKKMYIVPI